MTTEYPFPKAFPQWEKQYIQLSELGPRLTMSDLSRRFRSEEPRLLIYEVPGLGWRGVIACAPINAAFGAIEVLRRILSREMIEWGRSLIDDPEIYDTFESQLRRNKIKKENVPSTLLWPYTSFGAYVSCAKRPFGSKAPFLDYLRVSGWLLSNDASGRLEFALERTIRKSGEWAFCRADDVTPREPHSQWPLSDVPALFGAPFVIDGEGIAERSLRLAQLSTGLSVSCSGLATRPRKLFESHYHEIARPRLDLFANGSGFARESLFDEVVAEIVAKRIELVTLLGWPTFFGPIMDALSCYEQGEFLHVKYDWARKALRQAAADLQRKHEWLGEARAWNLTE